MPHQAPRLSSTELYRVIARRRPDETLHVRWEAMKKNDHDPSFSWSAAARIVYWVAFPVLFVAAIAVYGLGHCDMPKATRLGDGSTAYFLCSWIGAMFWPLATFLFLTYLAVGYGLGMSRKRPPISPPSGKLQPQVFLAVMGLALAVTVVLPEISGVSPFRHFYCVVVSDDAVVCAPGSGRDRFPGRT